MVVAQVAGTGLNVAVCAVQDRDSGPNVVLGNGHGVLLKEMRARSVQAGNVSEL